MEKIDLFIHNGGYIFSAALSFIIGIFVLARGPKILFHRLYFLSNLGFSIYALFYILGTGTNNPELSRFFFMFSLVNLFTVTTNAHAVWEFLGLGKKFKPVWMTFYITATILLLFFITNSHSFLLSSKPYLYLNNFINPGNLYWLFVAFFSVVAVFFIGTLFKRWLSSEGSEKTRIAYFFVAFTWAYFSGSIAFLPIFGINADPVFSAFVGIHVIVLAYAMLNKKLIDLHIVASRAITFSIFTVLGGLLIIAGNWLGNYASVNVPGFPAWIAPLISGVAVAIIGFLVMRRLREADLLKYEFINNISHKFRTPLTHIRWLSEELR